MVAFAWWTFVAEYGAPDPGRNLWWDHFIDTRVWPLAGVALLYGICFVGYGKPYRPPRGSDFSSGS